MGVQFVVIKSNCNSGSYGSEWEVKEVIKLDVQLNKEYNHDYNGYPVAVAVLTRSKEEDQNEMRNQIVQDGQLLQERYEQIRRMESTIKELTEAHGKALSSAADWQEKCKAMDRKAVQADKLERDMAKIRNKIGEVLFKEYIGA